MSTLPNPGDMVEWVYQSTGKPVKKDEELYSTTMEDWVPIGAPVFLVAATDETFSWLTPKGLFHARVDDTAGKVGSGLGRRVVSRKFER